MPLNPNPPPSPRPATRLFLPLRMTRGGFGACRVMIGLLVASACPPVQASPAASSQPIDAPTMSLDELKPGMTGEVWTVFRGSTPEPFSVEVTGVIRNAVGPGKALILCQLTDPRVQSMGAVAGMSGSPLYVGGRLAGALSYQVQRFETVRYAGFTPVDDLEEVADKVSVTPLTPSPITTTPAHATPRSGGGGDSGIGEPFQALAPLFSLSGLSPQVADLFAPQFRALGLATTTIGGSQMTTSVPAGNAAGAGDKPGLGPGEAVAVALAVGDITIAGTGTVSRVEGNRVTAFGHPMLGIGDVALAMCSAEIVTILPSNLNSMKVSNVGEVIGTLLQDRLSAVAGELGPGPAMIPVEVATPRRTLKFSIVRHPQIAPLVVAVGVTQAVVSSNDSGFSEGFRVSTRINFPGESPLETTMLYAGPQGFATGLEEFLQKLNATLQNPFERIFPDSVSVHIEPLKNRPWGYLDQFQPSATRVRAGGTVGFQLTGRDHQGAAMTENVRCDVPAAWVGKALEVVVMNGRELDKLTGQASTLAATDVCGFSEYLAALRSNRQPDGLYVAVVERADALFDQNERLLDAPGSIERITQGNTNSRYGRQNIAVSLWERRVFPDRLISATIKRTFAVSE